MEFKPVDHSENIFIIEAGQSDTLSFLKLNHAHKVPHNCIALVFGIIVNLF